MELKIFFDESGKKNNPPMLMGAVSVPLEVYNLEHIQEINNNLKKKLVEFHFTGYNGNRNELNNMLEVFKAFAPILHTMRLNILHYKKCEVEQGLFTHMVYSKFPERVFYGLLRCKGNQMKINAEIFMEEATEYKGFPELFKDQLNTQATYRGEQYKIKECHLVPKKTEIGVEFTDLILGVIRTIIDDKGTSKTAMAKKEFVNKVISIPEVYTFLSNIKYFEWDNSQFLKEIEFKDYLDAYYSRHFIEINHSKITVNLILNKSEEK